MADRVTDALLNEPYGFASMRQGIQAVEMQNHPWAGDASKTRRNYHRR